MSISEVESVKEIKHRGHPRLYRMRKKRMAILVARLNEVLRAVRLLERVRMHIEHDTPLADCDKAWSSAFSAICRAIESLEQGAEGDIEELEGLKKAMDREIDLVLGPAPENHTESKKTMTRQNAIRVREIQKLDDQRALVYAGMIRLLNAIGHLRKNGSPEDLSAIELLGDLEGPLERENKALCQKAGDLRRAVLQSDGAELSSKEIAEEQRRVQEGTGQYFDCWNAQFNVAKCMPGGTLIVEVRDPTPVQNHENQRKSNDRSDR
jgi:hypothetical protein